MRSDRLHTTIQGIPCQIEITNYSPGRPGGPPASVPLRSYMDIVPPEDEEIEFEVRDRKGYRAKWLENKIDEDLRSELEIEIRDFIKDKQEDEKERKAEEKLDERMTRREMGRL